MNRQKVSGISWCCLNFTYHDQDLEKHTSSKTNALGKSLFSTHPSLPSSNTKSRKSWWKGTPSWWIKASIAEQWKNTQKVTRQKHRGWQMIRKWRDDIINNFFSSRFSLKNNQDFMVHVKLPSFSLVSLNGSMLTCPKTNSKSKESKPQRWQPSIFSG